MTDRLDPLHAPLGGAREAAEKRASAGGGAGKWGWAAATLGMAGFVALVAATEPKAPGGFPRAVARIETLAPLPTAPARAPAASTAPASARGPQAESIAAIEAASGVKVHRGAGVGAPNALIIEVPQAPPAPLALALAPAPDPRLVERTPQGLLPRVGLDGARPAEVYARPVLTGPGIKPGAPRIAIYVGGLGLARAPTESAIALPAAITLAFAPFGGDLAGEVGQARAAGHEVLLQVPMEPADYPANNPGPDTLLASDPGRNLERLHAMMGRFTGYVGIANHLGGRFLADEAALAPVLRDVAARGLFFAEDAPLDRSRVDELAGKIGLNAILADVVIDRSDKPDAVKASLDALEALARERGVAVAAASALPNALAEIKRWAPGLEARGIALVPLSAMATSASPAPSRLRRAKKK